MQCPVDNTTLVMADRLGIEIDYCPTCRGIWLDRGELDKIIERSDAQLTHSPSRENDEDSRPTNGTHDPQKRKRGSFIGDILGGFGGE